MKVGVLAKAGRQAYVQLPDGIDVPWLLAYASAYAVLVLCRACSVCFSYQITEYGSGCPGGNSERGMCSEGVICGQRTHTTACIHSGVVTGG
jgi:hypothetical protein